MTGTLPVFSANDGLHGVEPWRSDGTEAGTVMIQDLNPGVANSDPASFTSAGGALLFSAIGPTTGRELWRLDP